MEKGLIETMNLWLGNPTVGKVLLSIVILVILISISRIIKRSITRYIKGQGTRYRLRKVVTFLSYFLVILLLTLVFNESLGSLTVALGVAGAGVAFALQEVIASFAGWFAINFANFYSTGDRVQLGGIKGDVIDISFLRTTLMEMGEWVDADLYNGRVVRVANSFVFKEPVFNYTGEFPFLWDEIKIPVKYGSDQKLAGEILEKIAYETVGDYSKEAAKSWDKFSKQFLLEDAQVDPMITLILTDNWIEFTLRYVVDFKLRRSTKNKLFSRIIDDFNATDGAVEIASATFHLVETPPFDVRVSDARK